MARKTNYTKHGQKYFRVTKSIGRDSSGKLIRKEFYGDSKKDAIKKRDEYLRDLQKGLIADSDAMLGPTMYTWLFEVVRVSEDISPATFERYEGIYRNYIKGEILDLGDGKVGDLYYCILRDLKSIEIQRYYNRLYETYGKSSSIIGNLHKLLRSFLNYTVDEGYIEKNPCVGKKRKKITIPGETKNKTKKIEIFTDDEIIAFQKAIAGHQYEVLFLLALSTGLRQGELLALGESKVNIKKCCVSVAKTIAMQYVFSPDGTKEYKMVEGPTKNRQTRVVPFPHKLAPKLKDYITQKKIAKLQLGPAYKDKGYFFSNSTGGPVDARTLLRSHERVLKAAGILYRKFHALRHTYATQLIDKGIPIEKVQILLGHNKIETTQIYLHLVPEKITEAADKIGEILL